MNFGFVINNETCIGCHACSTACKSENEVPLGVNRTWVKSVETGVFPDVTRHFQVTRCNHCENPPCVKICPVSAMYQRDDGIVEFDGDICIGCKACLQACPYDAIYIDPNTGTAAKCHYCGHRIDVGLEPACVVVCPEHAIIAGDMDNADSEISRTLARRKVTVRKPEQGTSPKVFYIGGEEASLQPTNTERTPRSFAWADTVSTGDGGPIRAANSRLAEQMVQVVYNAQHKIPWHWQVPAYLVTKGIGAGVFLLLAAGYLLGLFGLEEAVFAAGALASLVFLGLTTVLLVFDLERPERFLRILTRPQWGSWLVRGAFLLVAFSGVVTLWAATELGILRSIAFTTADVWRDALFWIGIPLAIGTAMYTAFLFGQAEGRDLWQSTLLPIHLVIQSLLAGSAGLMAIGVVIPMSTEMADTVESVLVWSVILDAAVILIGELGMPHANETAVRAAHEITSGKYRIHFWFGAVFIGHVIPLISVVVGGPAAIVTAASVLIGLYYYEYAFVLAPQQIPNS